MAVLACMLSASGDRERGVAWQQLPEGGDDRTRALIGEAGAELAHQDVRERTDCRRHDWRSAGHCLEHRDGEVVLKRAIARG